MLNLAPEAVALYDKGTLALVIEGDIPDRFRVYLSQSIVVKIDEIPLTECRLLTDSSGKYIVALLPQGEAEKICIPGQASDIRIEDLEIKDAEVDWVSFPPKASGGVSFLNAPLKENVFSAQPVHTEIFSESSQAVALPSLSKIPEVHLPEEGETEAKKKTDFVQETGSKKSARHKILLAGIIFLFLLFLGGIYGAYYFFSHRSIEQMAPENVVQAKMPLQQITEEGERRLNAGQKDDGFRLIKYAALHNDPTALRLIGEMYDPASFKSDGAVLKANSDEAARYYQAAAQAGDQKVLEERTRLLENLREKARAGDQNAALTLKAYGS